MKLRQAVSLLLEGTGDLLGASDDSGSGGQNGEDGGKGGDRLGHDVEDASKAELLLFGGFIRKIHFHFCAVQNYSQTDVSRFECPLGCARPHCAVLRVAPLRMQAPPCVGVTVLVSRPVPCCAVLLRGLNSVLLCVVAFNPP